MVELGAEPCISAVAGFAGGRESRSLVIGRYGLLIVRCVAGEAGSREAGELASGRTLVAVHAFEHCVGAEQRKAIFMLLQLLCLGAPPFYRVTFLTSGPKLSAMNVGMAISAPAAHVGENQADVALRAAHFFMHSPERVARAIVIEFRDAADGLPTGVRVAIFAGDGDGAVRIVPRFLIGLRLREILPRNPEGQ